MQNKKIYFFVFIGVIIFYIIFASVRFWMHVEIGKDLRDKAVPFNQQVDEPAYKILVIGDSSAVGVGASEPELSVAGRIGADYPNAQVINKGKSGMRTAGLLEEFKTLEKEKYDLILIQIGGNDLIRFVPVKEAKHNMEQVFQIAKQMSDNIVILSAGNMETAYIFPIPLRVIYGVRSLSFRKELIELSDEYNIYYVDLYREVEHDPFAKDPKKFYAPDLFHPSGEGYGVWYERIGPVIEKILN